MYTQRWIQVLWGLKLIQYLGPSSKEKKYKITNTKLGTNVDIYLGPLPGPSKGFVQIKGPES